MFCFFFFKQKTAYEMRISDWSSDVCSSDLFVMTGKLDFNSLANSIISDLIRIQIQRAITLPLANFAMSLFAPAAGAALPLGSGDLMGVNANIAHSGGPIGRASCRERVCQYV